MPSKRNLQKNPSLSRYRLSMKKRMQMLREKKRISLRPNENCTEELDLPPLVVECNKDETSWSKLEGNRIFNPGYVIPYLLNLQSRHTRQCTAGTVQFIKEVRKRLECQWLMQCNGCNKKFTVANQEPPHENLNSAGAWAAITSGIGFAQFENVLSIIEVPAMCKTTFLKSELRLEKVWNDHLNAAITEAGVMEHQLALENGDVDEDGVPFVTVIVDGGWNKRSYGHNYSAASGVAVIIGQRTGKLLFMGIRNKYCCICERAIAHNASVPPHVCYKNWDKCRASTSMEQDIIVEGFRNSETMHNLRYKYFVGDGDSSVFARLMQNVAYGRFIHKIECANHCVKNYTSALHKLAADKNFPAEARKNLKSNIPRLTAAARGAIRHCSDNGGDVEDLVKDLKNGPYHVFGKHSQCREYFCKDVTDDSSIDNMTNSKLFDHVQGIVNRLVSKAPRLTQNKTSNRAEFFMSLLAKYNAGKRINYTQRGSFQRRCTVTGMRFQKGYSWETSPFKSLTGKSPGRVHKRLVMRRVQKHQTETRRKLLYPKQKHVGHNKDYCPPDEDYGPDAEQPEDYQELQTKCDASLQTLEVTAEQREAIVHDTREQCDSELWHNLRRVRLTASKFGAVCKRKHSTPCAPLVKRLLYKPPISTAAIEYGRSNEHVAVKRFEEETGLLTQKCGLFIDAKYGFLGGSPDGIINGENAIIEVKCVPSAIGIGLQTMAKTKKGFFLEEVDGKLKLKKTHDHYFQVQGELNISGCEVCFFVVMTDMQEKLHIEKVFRDTNFWETSMLPKLEKFYKYCRLPEIVEPNIVRGRRIREPQYIVNARIESDAKKKSGTNLKKK